MKRVTIHDVAKSAGVSLATVDRVLNGRPGVRKTTIERVQQAVESLNYKPDVFAAGLAKKRLYRFHFLLPNGPNAFMEDLTREALNHAQTMTGERIQVHVEPIDAFDGHKVAGTLAILDKTKCDGVAVVAPRVSGSAGSDRPAAGSGGPGGHAGVRSSGLQPAPLRRY